MEGTAAAPMTFLEMAVLIIVGGLIGGIADFMRPILPLLTGVGYDEKPFTRRHLWLLIPSSFIGISSAIAIQLVFEFLRANRLEDIAENQFFLLSVSVIAGFSGRRFLPGISDHLEQQISQVKEKVGQVDQHVKQETQRIEQDTRQIKQETQRIEQDTRQIKQETQRIERITLQRTSLNESIMRAIATLGREPIDPQELWLCIEELEEWLKGSNIHRTLTIVLGRLYKARRDYEAATAVLDVFLNKKRELKQFDRDYADVLYNKACYVCLMSVETGDIRLIDAVLAGLKESIKYSDANRETARSDPDLKSIWDHPGFKALVKAVEQSTASASSTRGPG